MAYLAKLRDRFSWFDIDEHTYDSLLQPLPDAAPSAPRSAQEGIHV